MKNESGLTLNQLAERNANLVTEIEKCRELSGCPAGVDLQDWVKQLSAENVALKQAESNLVRNIINDLGDTEFQYARVHTPATDAYLSGIKADGVEQYAALFADTVNMEREHNQQFHKGTLWFAKQLREGTN